MKIIKDIVSYILGNEGFTEEYIHIHEVVKSCKDSTQKQDTISWGIKVLQGRIKTICKKHPLLKREIQRQSKFFIDKLFK